MQILDYKQAKAKVKRISLEILEKNLSVNDMVILGINQSGFRLAQEIIKSLEAYIQEPIPVHHLEVKASDPLEFLPTIEGNPSLQDKNIILVDDVCNTGRTLFYALSPILRSRPKSVEALVLVDRQHKRFPIHIDYVGMRLATTLHDHIRVEIDDQGIQAFLD